MAASEMLVSFRGLRIDVAGVEHDDCVVVSLDEEFGDAGMSS
jgi:hypothetical protein